MLHQSSWLKATKHHYSAVKASKHRLHQMQDIWARELHNNNTRIGSYQKFALERSHSHE